MKEKIYRKDVAEPVVKRDVYVGALEERKENDFNLTGLFQRPQLDNNSSLLDAEIVAISKDRNDKFIGTPHPLSF